MVSVSMAATSILFEVGQQPTSISRQVIISQRLPKEMPRLHPSTEAVRCTLKTYPTYVFNHTALQSPTSNTNGLERIDTLTVNNDVKVLYHVTTNTRFFKETAPQAPSTTWYVYLDRSDSTAYLITQSRSS